MTNDITSELAKLHELTGAEFSRQLERIAKRKEFHPLETDKDIFSVGGQQSDDYDNLLQAEDSHIVSWPCHDMHKNGCLCKDEK